MMANVLGAGLASAGNGTAGTTRDTGTHPRDPQAFERLLKQDQTAPSPRAKTEAAPAEASARGPTAADVDPDTLDDATLPGPDESAGAALPGSADSDAAAKEPPAEAWPPAGLAGLVLSAPMPPLDPSAPAAARVQAGAAPAGSPAAVVSALATVVPTGAAAAGTALDAEAVADAPGVADVDALLATIAAEAGESSDEATAPALLHVPAAAPATRAGLDVGLVRALDPTPTPVLGQEGFDEAISTRLGWLAEQKIGHAHIRISPDDMGTIDVRLQMDGDKVHASFSSPHVEVRHALESSLPRLRELLGEQGFQLAHADVGQQSQGDPGGSRDNGSFHAGAADGEHGAAEVALSSAQLIRQRGLLDVHA